MPTWLHNIHKGNRLISTAGCFVAIAGMASAQVWLTAPVTSTTPNSASAMAVADLNGDGKVDLATCSSNTASATIYLNAGNGQFTAGGTYPVGIGPSGIAVGDVTGDGVPDLVVCTSAAKTVNVLKGILINGTLTYASIGIYPVAQGPTSVAVGDLNGDGKLDIALCAPGSPAAAYTLINQGNGIFGAVSTYPVNTFPTSVTIGDFNGDGAQDVVVANQSSSLSTLINKNDGSGSLNAYTKVACGLVQESVVTADFNGDGKLDVASADNRANGVQVLLGTGNGTLQAPHLNKAGSYAWAATTGDVNKDGKTDIILIDQTDPNVMLFLGNGDGTFQPAVTYAGNVNDLHTAVAVADVDGDSLPDIICTNAGNTLSVFLNQTSWVHSVTFSQPTVTVGGVSLATITLTRPAPAGDLRVAVTSSDPAIAPVNSPVIIAAGTSSITFPVATGPNAGTVNITATLNGGSVTAALKVNPVTAVVHTDVNSDGVVDLTDVVAVLRVAGGLDPAW